jgi:hypothetical protein
MAAGVQSGAAIEGLLYIEASTNPRSGSCTGHSAHRDILNHGAAGRAKNFPFAAGLERDKAPLPEFRKLCRQ